MHHMGRVPVLSATDAIIVPARSLFDVNAIMDVSEITFSSQIKYIFHKLHTVIKRGHVGRGDVL